MYYEVKMHGLSTSYLSNLMTICNFDPKTFKGVFSCDNFYQKFKATHPTPGDQYIINLSSSNHSGSHWVHPWLVERSTSKQLPRTKYSWQRHEKP